MEVKQKISVQMSFHATEERKFLGCGYMTQLKTLNGRQFGFSIKIKLLQTKLDIKCFYMFRELSKNSETCVRCEITLGTRYRCIFI